MHTIILSALFVALASPPAQWWHFVDSQTGGATSGMAKIDNLTLPRPTSFRERAYAATAILYSQDSLGTMNTKCTATVFEKKVVNGKQVYGFVAASHCVAEDDTEQRRVEPYKDQLYVSFDELGEKKFYKAELKAAGYRARGDDFAILTVESDKDWPVIPIGDEKKEKIGAAVFNVATPYGLGKELFSGFISLPKIDRPLHVEDADINWSGALLLQLTSGPGSSGSAIFSEDQQAIIGLVVGMAGNITIGVPASKLKLFQELSEQGKYHWYRPGEE